MRKFYWRWLTLAFRHSFDYASLVATIISLIVALGTYAANRFQAKVKLLEQINEMGGWGYALAAAGVLVVCRLILAPYWIYQEGQKKIADTGAELDKIRRDKLRAEISRFMFCEDGTSGVCVMLRVISIGPPTTAHSWTLTLALQGRERVFKPQHLIDDSIQWPIGDKSFVKVKAEDMIYEKLAKPITEGGTEVGFLFFPMGDITQEQLESEKPTLTIRFRDAMQTEYGTSADNWGHVTPMHEPGIDDPFAAVTLRQMKNRQLASEAARRDCLTRCIESFNGVNRPQSAIGALDLTDAYKLETTEDVIWVCEELERRGHGDAFGWGKGYGEGVESGYIIPQKDWLRFLTDAKLARRSLVRDVDAYDVVQEWLITGSLRPPHI